jgi:hypothetical protein
MGNNSCACYDSDYGIAKAPCDVCTKKICYRCTKGSYNLIICETCDAQGAIRLCKDNDQCSLLNYKYPRTACCDKVTCITCESNINTCKLCDKKICKLCTYSLYLPLSDTGMTRISCCQDCSNNYPECKCPSNKKDCSTDVTTNCISCDKYFCKNCARKCNTCGIYEPMCPPCHDNNKKSCYVCHQKPKTSCGIKCYHCSNVICSQSCMIKNECYLHGICKTCDSKFTYCSCGETNCVRGVWCPTHNNKSPRCQICRSTKHVKERKFYCSDESCEKNTKSALCCKCINNPNRHCINCSDWCCKTHRRICSLCRRYQCLTHESQYNYPIGRHNECDACIKKIIIIQKLYKKKFRSKIDELTRLYHEGTDLTTLNVSPLVVKYVKINYGVIRRELMTTLSNRNVIDNIILNML